VSTPWPGPGHIIGDLMASTSALYADLDGTLLGPGGSLFVAPDGGVTERAAGALAALHRARIELVLVSGRTRDQLREAARILGASAAIAELGAFVVERGADGSEEVVPNLGAFRGPGTPFEAMAREGAGAFLLERYAGRLEPHAPWAFRGREATMLLRGLLDVAEASRELDAAGYGWLELLDNGRLRRPVPSLSGLREVRAYHLLPRGVSKASGVRLHLARRSFDPAACAAVGDGASDLALAAEVGTVYLVADHGAADDGPAGTGGGRVVVTEEGSTLGFAQAVEAFLGGMVRPPTG
jgi:phosphoglycolate phosphatase